MCGISVKHLKVALKEIPCYKLHMVARATVI